MANANNVAFGGLDAQALALLLHVAVNSNANDFSPITIKAAEDADLIIESGGKAGQYLVRPAGRSALAKHHAYVTRAIGKLLTSK